MDSTSKHGISSETSREENEQPGKVNEGTGRYYECSYCKRGFTNAQALGGHMNIHRKDKAMAKAKKLSVETSVPQKSNERFTNCEYFAPILGYRYEAPGIQMNCPMYFPASNPSHMTADSEFSAPHGEYLRANLSLRIGASFVEDNEEEKKKDEKWNRKGNHEVDLELRLGQKP